MFRNQLFVDHLPNTCSWVIHKFHRKTPVLESLFNEAAVLTTCSFIKEDSKNNYFGEHLWTSASKLYLKRDSNAGVFLWILWIIQEHLFCRGSMNCWFWNTSARTCAFHFVEIFHLVAIFAINEWKLIRLILNRLKYKRIKLLILYWCNIIL